MPLTGKDVGAIVTFQFGGKMVKYVADWVDTKFPTASAKLYTRPSVWINIAGGLGLLGAALMLPMVKDRPVPQLLCTILGSSMVTELVDVIDEAVSTPATRAGVVSGAGAGSAIRVSPRVPAIRAYGM